MATEKECEFVTYVLRGAITGRIKIGKTAREVRQRLDDLQTGSAEDLEELMPPLDGDREAELHAAMDAYRVRYVGRGNEWFLPECVPALRDYLGMMPPGTPEPVTSTPRPTFSRQEAEQFAASADPSVDVDPNTVRRLLLPFNPRGSDARRDRNFGGAMRDLRRLAGESDRANLDQRVVTLLASRGGALLRQLLYLVKRAAAQGIGVDYQHLEEDLRGWGDGTNAAQNRWAAAYFRGKVAT